MKKFHFKYSHDIHHSSPTIMNIVILYLWFTALISALLLHLSSIIAYSNQSKITPKLKFISEILYLFTYPTTNFWNFSSDPKKSIFWWKMIKSWISCHNLEGIAHKNFCRDLKLGVEFTQEIFQIVLYIRSMLLFGIFRRKYFRSMLWLRILRRKYFRTASID